MKIKRKIYAADGDFDDDFGSDFGGGRDMFGDDGTAEDSTSEPVDSEDLKTNLDSLSDDLDHIKDLIEDDIMSEDPTSIAIDNNIEQHYIAECEECKGVFISAVVKSDQKVDKISGICPLCEKSTDQYLRWVIVDANEA